MKFECEVLEVKARKTSSLDIEYRVVLRTNDSNVLALGSLDGDSTILVEVIS